MTRHDIAVLACRLLALWLILPVAIGACSLVLAPLAMVVGLGPDWSIKPANLVFGISRALMTLGPKLIVGVFLWTKAGTLADRMVSDDPTPVTRPDIDPKRCLSIATAMIGMYYLLPALGDLFSRMYMALDSIYHSSEWRYLPEWRQGLWSDVFELAMCVWFVMGAGGMARFILWSRTAGRPPVE